MKELEYPFETQYLMRKRKAIRRQLLENDKLIEKRIAVLGGSTTHDIKDMLELFLLNYGIKPVFFESEYNQYWQDAMFGNPELESLKPDVIFIHTSACNIINWPSVSMSRDEVSALLDSEYNKYISMWQHLADKYHCVIIQNNFEYPYYRLLGNKDASDYRGRVNFVNRLNALFAEYADNHDGFYINDINYQAADYGLSRWADRSAWYMYKYALSLDAVPYLAFNVANIIKSVYGKNKKAVALDLDNTLWGGIVGDDGPENLELGQETALGQAYSEFQSYLKSLKAQGVILNVISKNEEDNAMAGLNHPQMVLKPDDFISVKANWEPKSVNLVNTAAELSLLPESFVFADDNPAEREIIRQQVEGVGIPSLDKVEDYISAVDKAGYFEVTAFSADDLKRNEMYKENIKRIELEQSFADYNDYLLSLDMKAEIKPFEPVYMSRIAQLTNKSNQFNLTTKRFTQEEIEAAAVDSSYITLYGSLADKFGDNGVVAISIGEIKGKELDLILWLMSCRVLKRDMEFAMMDEMVRLAEEKGISVINGYYYPTAKNAMVKDFYGLHGFEKVFEDEAGNAKWVLDVSSYTDKNKVIKVN